MFGNSAWGTQAWGASPPQQVPIDPARWAGVPSNHQFDEARTKKLQGLIDQALRDLDALGAGNAEKAQARSLLVATHALSEAPEPPSELIWKILERGMAIVGACQMFYQIAEALTK